MNNWIKHHNSMLNILYNEFIKIASCNNINIIYDKKTKETFVKMMYKNTENKELLLNKNDYRKFFYYF